jgi:O-antigen/teichoic acid export membrane protein
MSHLKNIYTSRHKIVNIGLPALVSRGTMAVWGVLTVLIIRALPEEMYAVYAVARSLEMFGVLLGGGFIQQAMLKLVAEGRSRREEQLANAGIVAALAFAVLAAVFMIAGGGLIRSFYSSLDLSGVLILLAGVIISGTISGLPRILLLSRYRTKDVMLSDILQFLVRGGIIGVLILNGTLSNSQQIFSATIAANVCAFFLSLFLARKYIVFSAGLAWGRVLEILRFSAVILGTALANFVYSRTDILMLGKMAPGDIAAYGASRSLAAMILIVNAAANMVLLPLLSSMWKQGQRAMVASRIWSSILIAEAIVLPGVIVFVLFPRQVLDFIFSGKYTAGWPILLVLGALSLVRPLGSIFSTAAVAVGKPKYSLYGVVVSAIVNVGLNFLLIPSMGGVGAAIATAFAVVLGTCWVVFASLRFIRSNSHL